jgi:hypothetical protein
MVWWAEANPGYILLFQGSGMNECNEAATNEDAWEI